MPLKEYAVLKGRSVDRRLGVGSKGHYPMHVVDETTDDRIVVPEMRFRHPDRRSIWRRRADRDAE